LAALAPVPAILSLVAVVVDPDSQGSDNLGGSGYEIIIFILFRIQVQRWIKVQK
jgi:hypothetical protein